MKKREIVVLWLLWFSILFIFQQIVSNRFFLVKPDTALNWTVFETQKFSWDFRPYLKEPFLNEHAAWDSEFYLAIADKGYDNPDVRKILGDARQKSYSLCYAFLPFYPLLIRAVSYPLQILKMKPIHLSQIAVLTLSGIIISALGVLAGLMSLFFLCKKYLPADEISRSLFYLLIFPASFFLIEVYTEGLFIGLAFTSLALMEYKKFWLAAILAALAVWTRATGISLVIPLLWLLFRELKWDKERPFWASFRTHLKWLSFLIPVAAFCLWKFSLLGHGFDIVERDFFGRTPFNLFFSLYQWGTAFFLIFTGGNKPTCITYGVDFISFSLAFLSCIILLKKIPSLSLFGLCVLGIPFFSGSPQSINRYVLAVPTLYMLLSRWGKNRHFERGWTMASILLLGSYTTLFISDMWAG